MLSGLRLPQGVAYLVAISLLSRVRLFFRFDSSLLFFGQTSRHVCLAFRRPDVRGDTWMRYLSDDYPDNCRPIGLQSLRLVRVDDLIKSLGRRIRELRVQRGWSQEEFADVCGVHRTHMGHLERGEKNVSFSSLAKVAGALSVPISDLFTDLERAGIPTKEAGRPAQRSQTDEFNRDTVLKKLAVLERGFQSLKDVVLRSSQPIFKSQNSKRTNRKS